MNNDEKVANSDVNGGRRLIILGVATICIAFAASSISLFIYTSSGDIYLDRSRPGFISEDEPPENNNQSGQPDAFSADGAVSAEVLEEYVRKLDAAGADILVEPDAFSAGALSDEALNITGAADY